MLTEIDLPASSGKPLTGDDSEARGNAIIAPAATGTQIAQLPDGARMVWERDSSPPAVGQLGWFRFRVEDSAGKPVNDLEPYMGMAGHAVFVRSDRSVFAHVHPAGSVPMAALAMVEKDIQAMPQDQDMVHRAAMPLRFRFRMDFPGRATIGYLCRSSAAGGSRPAFLTRGLRISRSGNLPRWLDWTAGC